MNKAKTTRRQFIGSAVTGVAGTALLGRSALSGAPAVAKRRPPNLLFINVDQLNIGAIGAHGCTRVLTPNMDRLAQRGVSFRESYSADPVCCPARAAWFTGRPSCENGVVTNLHFIRDDLPDLGQWLGARGYDPVYSGKWHIPGRDVTKSFRVLPGGTGQGEYGDGSVSRAAQGFLRNHEGSKPFFLALGFLQPHDICYWIMRHFPAMASLPYPEISAELPPLPPNFKFDLREPAQIKKRREGIVERSCANWSDLQWRYYLWSYYRHVEMVDAEVGRVLEALEDSRFARDTLVILSSDHGEGMGNHQLVTKSFLYESAAKVPMIVSWPGVLPERLQDHTRLVSGLDMTPTLCDFGQVEAPPKARGRSLRPLLDERPVEWREFVVTESQIAGRMVRTADYKYIAYKGDPVEQLFDLRADPFETRNVAGETKYADVLAAHQKMLAAYEAPLERAPLRPTPLAPAQRAAKQQGRRAKRAEAAGKAEATKK
ncbi:sulfatase-like hydrolase/transferase [Candidatus Sumerlaeota bacterium]|nr:sulfatase-like hydrolase/transferase [Candidatus Sumerlaeota bacterium]